MDSTQFRLVAHVGMIALLQACIVGNWLAKGRGMNWKYWRLFNVVLAVWLLWFFGLAISTKGTALVSRELLAWTLGVLELTGTFGAWCWWVLTLRATFCLSKPKRIPPALGHLAGID